MSSEIDHATHGKSYLERERDEAGKFRSWVFPRSGVFHSPLCPQILK